MTPRSHKLEESAIRRIALAYPNTREDHPWGETAFKVKDKAFVFLRCDEEGLSIGMKLPHSNAEALEHPFCEPTHYGLGKSGWVTATFHPTDKVPMDLLKRWIDESFRAVAPKTLVKQMDGGMTSTKAKTESKARKKTKKK
jgi:predicted DNA-binding protein (MmcQ/YjbR family)